jgi:hypothetical protein
VFSEENSLPIIKMNFARSLGAVLLTVGLVTGGSWAASATPQTVDEETTTCGTNSPWIDQIQVEDFGNGNVDVHLYPSGNARWASYLNWRGQLPFDHRSIIVEEWHAIQNCVAGLYGERADSVWQQLECHQKLAFAGVPGTDIWATGPDYGLETWRPALPKDWWNEASETGEWVNQCGNELGIDNVQSLYEEGAPDLQHALDNWG